MESRFVIVDEHGRSDVHGVDQTKAFGDAAGERLPRSSV